MLELMWVSQSCVVTNNLLITENSEPNGRVQLEKVVAWVEGVNHVFGMISAIR